VNSGPDRIEAEDRKSMSRLNVLSRQLWLCGYCGWMLLAASGVLAQEAGAQSERLGFSKTKPAEGPSVEVPGGFMVPYTAKIPGTDVEFEMIPIPGGTFKMGSPESEADRRADEGPQFEVTIEPFWMGKYEVTWAEYMTFMDLDAAFKQFQQKSLRPVNREQMDQVVTAPSSLYDPSFTFEAGEEPDQPAATISQFAAKQYTKYLSLLSEDFYRLPTEAEWEYACRAGTTTAFYFGDDPKDLKKHAWIADNSDDERHIVGKKRANPWGLHDMYGNVAEWVLDGYSEDGYARHAGKSVTVAEAWEKPTKLFPRVLRGGSWELDVEDCRSAARMRSHDDEWKIEDPNFPRSPWWFTTSPALGAGFRIIRPYQAPASATDKAVYWDADVVQIKKDCENRIDANGRGAFGVIDPSLPAALEALRSRK
jgi:formylglycine-generating enzyme